MELGAVGPWKSIGALVKFYLRAQWTSQIWIICKEGPSKICWGAFETWHGKVPHTPDKKNSMESHEWSRDLNGGGIPLSNPSLIIWNVGQ